MYRCISELKGLIIDIDTFSEQSPTDWKDIATEYKCMFLVTNENIARNFERTYGKDSVFEIEPFIKLFAPNQTIHQNALKLLKLDATEVAYVSKNRAFLDNAMSFLGGTIWVTEEVNYEDAGKAPDLICRGFESFKNVILKNVKGFLGEVSIYPNTEHIGMIIPLSFDVDGSDYSMHMLGRYFGYAHYMSQLHPYSSAIFLNKNERGKAFGKYNDRFAVLYACAVQRIQKSYSVDGIVSVPTRPGKVERFEPILEAVSKTCGIQNWGANFKCITDYPTQKNLSSAERQENIGGVFQYNGDLTGKSVVLIDDIVTTGATIRECIGVLRACGAAKISVVVLAINQIQGYYWSSHIAQVTCDCCGEKMHLLINSNNKNFFYSCYGCKNTKSFEVGMMELCHQVNDEMK